MSAAQASAEHDNQNPEKTHAQRADAAGSHEAIVAAATGFDK
jgi:hypothetical protein